MQQKTEINREFIKKWVSEQGTDTFQRNEKGELAYTSENGFSSINLEVFFEFLLDDYQAEVASKSNNGSYEYTYANTDVLELAKIKIDYERQVTIFGKERADTALQMWILGYYEHTMPQKRQEYIICAANHYDDGNLDHVHKPKNIKSGFIICGRRHHNCIHTFAQMVGFPYSEESLKLRNTEIQGFLTNTDRFVDRKEAYKIAFNANQIIGPNKGCPENSIGLASEDLY